MKDKRESNLDNLIEIFKSAVSSVDPYKLINEKVKVDFPYLYIEDIRITEKINLNIYSKIIVIAIGKASAKMAKAIENIFVNIDFKGLVVTKYGHTEDLQRFEMIEAGHPIPDDNSIKAAEKIINLLQIADEKTLVITLISGGGSALVAAPVEGFILTDKQNVTKKLLESGATINEINCVRKHLSKLKGGGFLRYLNGAESVNLILSDVIGDRLDTIASGLTYFDSTTFTDAVSICQKYGISDEKILSYFQKGVAGQVEETLKKNDIEKIKLKNIIVGSNYHALVGAKKKAEELGFRPFVFTDELFGEAKEVAKSILAIARGFRKNKKEYNCLIFGGETTVTIQGNGKGGRNQEMALSFLNEMDESDKGIYFLSGGTDGNDGPTDAAGAVASYEIREKATHYGIKPFDFLRNNDAYNFFGKVDALVKTGPTNTNVCDIQIVISE
ncbi:glycerate kinase [Deferribacterales bacterium Es71-Z0220]|jgi:hydroxypyruvate reductase|uniref:glycerate kinase type-2 family protein n=1 Tax=Deferrivibrio essentukiensis TaxID=2880922 RepID=UPI001F60D0F2|nr:glycerate kinase [Deferrivibrio essentukiensis]MCB4204846.1 glycerate kinase [Deferrivibrio essentukiensis]